MTEPPDRRPSDDEILAYLSQLNDIATIARRRAWWRLGIGLAILAVASVISLATYSAAGQEATQEAARTGEGSGTYFIWWGPMVLGAWMALRAAIVLWRLRNRRP